jgi:putative flippase GtrA
LTSPSIAQVRLSRTTAIQFLRYVLTGGSAAIVDLSIFALLTAYKVPVLEAAVGSFLVAVVENYVVTSLFVYKTPLRALLLLKFAAFAALGLVINAGVTVALINTIGLMPVLAKVGGIGTAFVFNFVINTLVVFKARA